MADIIRLRSNPHGEVQELLPWLVNGTLDAEEGEQVEAHLAGCAECRGAFEAERQLAVAVAALSLDRNNSWERKNDGLEADPPARVWPASTLWRKQVPLVWAVMSPFAAAAAAALVFANINAMQPVQPQYHALGAAPVAQPANLVVQFEPASRVSDLQKALQSVDARVVDGPTETGAYLLRVNPARRELALKRLGDNRAIALAEPIDQAVAAFDPSHAEGRFPESLPAVVVLADQSLQNLPASVYGASGGDIPAAVPGGKWYLVNGTSYAAAHVSGSIALEREHRDASIRSPARSVTGTTNACAIMFGATRACDCDCRIAQAGRSGIR